EPIGSQPLDDGIESDAVTSHDHEVGPLSRPTDSLHRHGRIASDALNLSTDSNEAISLAERRDGARALGDWICSQRVVMSTRDEGDHKVLGAAALRYHAHGQSRRDALHLLAWQSRKGADHGRHELVKGENRRGREARQHYDGLATGNGETQRLAGLKGDAVHEHARISEPGNGAVAQVTGPF